MEWPHSPSEYDGPNLGETSESRFSVNIEFPDSHLVDVRSGAHTKRKRELRVDGATSELGFTASESGLDDSESRPAKVSSGVLQSWHCFSNGVAKRATRRIQIIDSEDEDGAEGAAAGTGIFIPNQRFRRRGGEGEESSVETGSDSNSSTDEGSVKTNNETNTEVCLFCLCCVLWVLMARLRPEKRPHEGSSPLWQEWNRQTPREEGRCQRLVLPLLPVSHRSIFSPFINILTLFGCSKKNRSEDGAFLSGNVMSRRRHLLRCVIWTL